MAADFSVERFYDDLARSWDATRPEYTVRIFERIAAHLGESCSSALDFGCGTGLLCQYLTTLRPRLLVHGIDLSSQMIERAKGNCPGGTFHLGDLSAGRLAAFDAVVSKDVFNHVQDLAAKLAAIDGCLNPGGVFVVANRERAGGVKKGILDGLATLGYSVLAEEHAFTPSSSEIDVFLRSLTGFADRHRAIIRQRLEAPAAYYILVGTKPRR